MQQHRTIEVISVSDTHGWIYGHRSDPKLGDYATLLAYVEHTADRVAGDKNNALFVVDGGDLVEGSGLSDTTQIIGQYIFEAASHIPWTILTVGNHDLYHPDTVSYLQSNLKKFYCGNYITTNVFLKGTDQILGSEIHKFVVLPNGLRCLMFGFMYNSNTFPSVDVRPAAETIRTPAVQKILQYYSGRVDFIFLDTHIGSMSKEHADICSAFRAFFRLLGYKIPIIAVAAHTHTTKDFFLPSDDEDGTSSQYYLVEAKCYMEVIQHVTYHFANISYSPPTDSARRYTGIRLEKVDVTRPPTSEVEVIAKHLGLTVDTLYTRDSVKLRKLIRGWVESLSLNDVIGYAKITYRRDLPVSDPTSLDRMFLLNIFGREFLSDRLAKECTQVVVMNSGSIRDDLPAGDIVLDQVFTIMPFNDHFLYIHALTGKQLVRILRNVNGHAEARSNDERSLLHFRHAEEHYVTKYNTIDDIPDGSYDLILPSFDAPRFMHELQQVRPTNSDSELLFPYPSKLDASPDKPITLREAFKRYIIKHLTHDASPVKKTKNKCMR